MPSKQPLETPKIKLCADCKEVLALFIMGCLIGLGQQTMDECVQTIQKCCGVTPNFSLELIAPKH